MNEKVLLVDDDPNVLQAYKRRLRKRFDVETALCSEEGVTAVNFLGPFAVVISDMKMPRENGAEFLAKIFATEPDSVRIMLTGNADQQAAADAVNVGRVFRFLNKPCPAEELEAAIEAGIEEHRRLLAQRELINRSVHGCVKMLSRVLALADPTAFGRAERLGRLAAELCEEVGVDDPWEVETAALLSQVGVLAVTTDVRAKRAAGESLTPQELREWSQQYVQAAELISEAPRLGRVGELIRSLSESRGPETRAEALLRLVVDFDHRTRDTDLSGPEAVEVLRAGRDEEDELIDALTRVVERDEERRLVEIGVEELVVGMRLVDDIVTTDGMVLVAQGQDVTETLRRRLDAYADSHVVKQPFRVLTPPGQPAELAACPA